MWITRTSRVILSRLELVRATNLDEPGHTCGAALVLPHATLLLNRLVTQEVALASGATQHFSGTGHLELLGDGFTCFNHGKNEQANGRNAPCKANSIDNSGKKDAPR